MFAEGMINSIIQLYLIPSKHCSYFISRKLPRRELFKNSLVYTIKINEITAQCVFLLVENLQVIWREIRQIIVQLVRETIGTWKIRNIFPSSLFAAVENKPKVSSTLHVFPMYSIYFHCHILGAVTRFFFGFLFLQTKFLSRAPLDSQKARIKYR
jgi:hypothetical protein